MYNNLSEELCSMSTALCALFSVAVYWNLICKILLQKKTEI